MISSDLKFGYNLIQGDGWAFEVEVSKIPDGCYIASVQYGGREIPGGGVEYVSGAVVEITIGSDGATLDGRVLDNDEHAREGAVIALIPAEPRGTTRSTKSGPQGSFRFGGVPPGDYRLIALDDVAEDDLQDPGFRRRFENQGTAVNLTANGTATASVRVIAQEVVR